MKIDFSVVWIISIDFFIKKSKTLIYNNFHNQIYTLYNKLLNIDKKFKKKKMKSKFLQFTPIEWILISIRSICLISALGTNYLLQNFLNMTVNFLLKKSSLFPFQIWKRYLSCVINLISTRIALLVLGFIFIESENFRFFSKE